MAVFTCTAGGVPWPQHVVMYNNKRQMIGHYNTRTFQGRTIVHSMRLSPKKTTVYVMNIEYSDEGSCCGTGTGRVSFTWSKSRKKLVAGSRYRYSERAKAQSLINAVNRRNRKAALRHGSSPVVAMLWEARRDGMLSLGSRCTALHTLSARQCFVFAGQSYRGVSLRMTHPKSSVSWKATRSDWSYFD